MAETECNWLKNTQPIKLSFKKRGSPITIECNWQLSEIGLNLSVIGGNDCKTNGKQRFDLSVIGEKLSSNRINSEQDANYTQFGRAGNPPGTPRGPPRDPKDVI